MDGNIYSNDSCSEDHVTATTGDFVLLILLSIFPPITIAGNILVICVVLRHHKFQQKANVFVVSLTVSDISVALFVMTPAIMTAFGNIQWLTLQPVCLLSFSLDVMFTSSSILHLMCMTVDRYIAICKPFKYHNLMSKRSVTALLFMCWVLPVLISFGLIFSEVHSIGVEVEDLAEKFHQNCIFVVNIYYAVFCSLLTFYIPSAFMLLCNILIFKSVKRQGRQLCEMSTSIKQEQHAKIAKREVKVARNIAIMLSCFFLCWLPFFVYNLLDPVIGYSVGKTTALTVTWLGYINSMLNPYLYYFLNKSFTSKCDYFCLRCKRGHGSRSNVFVIKKN